MINKLLLVVMLAAIMTVVIMCKEGTEEFTKCGFMMNKVMVKCNNACTECSGKDVNSGTTYSDDELLGMRTQCPDYPDCNATVGGTTGTTTTLSKKVLELAGVRQTEPTNYEFGCQMACGAMVMNYYLKSAEDDYDVPISMDDVVDWIWGPGSIDDLVEKHEGVPICNYLGSYNVICAKLEPNQAPEEPPGCIYTCPDDLQQCLACEVNMEEAEYDELIERCCYAGWTDYIFYKGKEGFESGTTSFRWGVNCMLKTGIIKWPDLPEIQSKCWGVMSPQDIVKQLDRGIPIIVWYGDQTLDAGSHAVVIIGYEYKDDEIDDEIKIIIADPLEVVTGTADNRDRRFYWQLKDAGWHQSLYIIDPPEFINN